MNGLLRIHGAIQPLKRITNQIVVCKARFFIGVDAVVDRTEGTLLEVQFLIRFIIEHKAVLAFGFRPV